MATKTKLTPEQRAGVLHSNLATSDCGVIALQAVTGLAYREAEAALVAQGYGPDHGSPRGALEKALHLLGYTCTYSDVPCQTLRWEPGDTAATYALRQEYGTWLVYIPKHVMALLDGNLTNSRGHWHGTVDGITHVTR